MLLLYRPKEKESNNHLHALVKFIKLSLHSLLRESDRVHLLLQAVAQDGGGVLARLLVLEGRKSQ